METLFFCFYFFGYLSGAAVDIYVQIFTRTYLFSSYGYMPRSGTARSCAKSVFNILKNCQTVFQNGTRTKASQRKPELDGQ